MTHKDKTTAAVMLELTITRRFQAPPSLVFAQWVTAEAIRDWFAPDTYATTDCTVDARPGGAWRLRYRSDKGDEFVENGVFREIAPPERLVLTLTQAHSAFAGPETVITVTFRAVDSGTEMTFHQSGFREQAHRDGNAEGWQECFDKLARLLAA